VKAPAAIAHEQAPGWRGKQFAERINAVLQRHCPIQPQSVLL
jgi:hypothetical protein